MKTQTELLISTAIDTMVEKLMQDFNATFQWSMRAILGSKTYQRMTENTLFRGESPLYIYEHLKQELKLEK